MIHRYWPYLLAMMTLLPFSKAQTPPPPPPESARPLPRSGRAQQPGSVTAAQSVMSGGNEVQLRGSVNVQGAYTGSVPTGDNTGTVLPLRLDYAVKLALRNNLGAVTEAQTVLQAEGEARSARSRL